MSTIRYETKKKPGVCYALTDDGLELPVVDVTHPAFVIELSNAEQAALVTKFMTEAQPLNRLPGFVRSSILKVVLRGSELGPAIQKAEGTYLTGMGTYLLKLGPQNLGDAYAKPVDRRIAAALPALGMRLRLQDMAQLMAEALTSRLAAKPGKDVHLIDIAGGPCADAWNALIAVRAGLAKRHVRIEALDIDTEGPSFGARALAALRGNDGPLEGLDVTLRRTAYDWNETTALKETVRDFDGVMIASSEGGLFEYGTDSVVLSNLDCLRSNTPEDFVIIGSVTRADAPIQRLHQTSRAATISRGLDAFRTLVAKGGWEIAKSVERPFSDQVLLQKRG